MHRFFVPPENVAGMQVNLSDDQTHQIMQVLRMQPGEKIVVLDDTGWEYEVRLTAVTRKNVQGEVVEKRRSAGEPAIHVSLYMSLMKRDKFEWVLQKCTEVGVSRFVPIVTQRSLVQEVNIKQNKWSRWQKIIQEAAEQSRRGRIPELCQPMKFGEALHALDTAVALIPWEEAQEGPVRPSLAEKAPESIALFIGPEGGFAADEVSLALANNVVPVTLGSRTLRSETAAIVAVALSLFVFEDK